MDGILQRFNSVKPNLLHSTHGSKNGDGTREVMATGTQLKLGGMALSNLVLTLSNMVFIIKLVELLLMVRNGLMYPSLMDISIVLLLSLLLLFTQELISTLTKWLFLLFLMLLLKGSEYILLEEDLLLLEVSFMILSTGLRLLKVAIPLMYVLVPSQLLHPRFRLCLKVMDHSLL